MYEDDDEENYYSDDDDDDDSRIDLGAFLDDGEEADEDDTEISDEESEERAAIKRIMDAVNREEARESFESIVNPKDGYPEEELDAFIKEWAYEFYDQGADAIDWGLVD